MPEYATEFDPGSPTDEDEPPPSPITSSISAQRRVQASPRFQTRASARKRSSDSSDSGNSPKVTRTFKGKQPVSGLAIPSPVFKKPSLQDFRSHQANTSFTGVANTGSSRQTEPEMVDSFASTVNKSFDTTSSSQRTLVDTANTSFASDVYDSDVKYPKLTRTSSTTLDSLDDEELVRIEVEAQLRGELARMQERNHSSQDHIHSSQEFPPRSSSAYGSVDEEVMLERSFTVEAEDYDSSGPAHQSSTRLPKGAELVGSVKKEHIPPIPSAEPSPFNRPPQGIHNHSSSAKVQQPHRTISDNYRAEALSQSPSKSLNDSPSKLPYYIRNIPDRDLFVDLLTEDLKGFPYFVLFICSRLASEHSIPLSTLLQGIDARSALADSHSFLEQVCINLNIPRDALRGQQKYWSAWKRDFEGYTFKSRIDYNELGASKSRSSDVLMSCLDSACANYGPVHSSSPVFKLNILPIEAEKSSRLQRKFGSDRFLYVNVPSFEPNDCKSSRFRHDDFPKIEQQFKLWCDREHSFLGRTWRAFHVEPIKKKKKGRNTDDLSAKRIVLFAIEGIGIEKPTIIGNMVNWFFPFAKNMHESYTKAYARLDLGLSRTIPTLTFERDQVRYVKNITANGTAEDMHFSDGTIDSWPQGYSKDTVMNDGCSLISVGAALLIWQQVRKVTNSDEPMPSAFQARIGGAKGVWMISGEPSSATDHDREIWIEISKSQSKFKPHKEDRSTSADLKPDPLRLTFEYVNHSRRPVPSELHISFVPILVDRGVPKNVIAELMIDRLDAERNELIQMLPNAERMYHWVHQEGRSNPGLESPQWQEGMYQSLPEQIKHLLESGFVPKQEPYLADCLYRFIKQRQLWMESKLRVPLHRSTFVLGIADPYGVLEPGQVHMEFSTPFTDELNGSRLRSLDNMEILVSRQPACRRSDIQKVRTVKRTELSHLIDVVVFPSKGQHPLAGKLQGGDYDGDIFWLCWDQAIVAPFKNAPAPVESPNHAKYGITKDTRELPAVMDPNDLGTVDDFLREAFEFRMAPSMLGIVTSYLEKQAYHENQVFSDRLDALCDMHDLLVDAPKQGFKFTKNDFDRMTINVLRCGNPKKPAYKQAMTDCEKKDSDENRDYKHNKENILDYLYFEVVRKHDVATLKQVKDVFSKELGEDPDCVLQHPYLQLRKDGSAEVQKELDALLGSLKIVETKWMDIVRVDETVRRPDWYKYARETCYDKYCSIFPTQVDHPDIKPWVYPFRGSQYSLWEVIRASAFYATFTKRHKLVWYMAGKQLAELKAASYPGSTMVVPGIKAIMKPRAPKAPKLEEDDSDDAFEDAVEEL
jgi:hypothetical protein